MGEASVGDGGVAPQFVASVEEVVDYGCGVDTVERAVFHADVVEAQVEGLDLEAGAAVFVVGVEVDVVVDGEVVYHLSDGYVVEEPWVGCEAEVFGEYLHYHSLADTYAALEHDVFVEFLATAGEHFFGEGALVEVVEEEAEDVAVVVVDVEAAALWGEDNLVGNGDEEFAVRLIDGGD